MINIGKYIETAINWLTENFAPLFDAINVGIGGFIDGFQNILMWIPFYVTIALLAILAWYKSGKGVSIFTILGLLLIWGMGFWTRSYVEFCILATKGNPKRINAGVHQVILSLIEEHSKKPHEARVRIVQLMGDLPRIELFARQATPGWDVWGNEVDSSVSFS